MWSVSNKTGQTNFTKDHLQDWKPYSSLSTQRALAFLFAATLGAYQPNVATVWPYSAPCPEIGGHTAPPGAACQVLTMAVILPVSTLHNSMPVCMAQEKPPKKPERDVHVGKALKNVCIALLLHVTARPRPPPVEPWCLSGQRGEMEL